MQHSNPNTPEVFFPALHDPYSMYPKQYEWCAIVVDDNSDRNFLDKAVQVLTATNPALMFLVGKSNKKLLRMLESDPSLSMRTTSCDSVRSALQLCLNVGTRKVGQIGFLSPDQSFRTNEFVKFVVEEMPAEK